MESLLFPPVEQRLGSVVANETAFEFLARGDRSETIKIKEWMENCFQNFPEGHREELKRRVQLKDFSEFMGAYFELQVFSILRRCLKCHVDVHPYFPKTDGTVDFRATHAKDTFFVEATVCGINQGNFRSNANEEDAVRKIRESIEFPHSDIWLEAKGELPKTLGRKRLTDPIRGLLNPNVA